VHGNLLVAIDTMHGHHQAVFVPMVTVRVLAVDVSTGRLTTLLTTNAPTSGAGIPTLIGW
jgi:hypothetical protein